MSHKRINVWYLIQSAAYATTFLVFGFILWSTPGSEFIAGFEIPTVAFRILSILPTGLFVLFLIATFKLDIVQRIQESIENVPSSRWWRLFLNTFFITFWIALIINYVGGMTRGASLLPSHLKLPAIAIGTACIITVILALLRILVLENVRAWWRNRPSSKHSLGWLSEEVASIMKQQVRERGYKPIGAGFKELAIPARKAAIWVTILLFASICISFLLALWDPKILAVSTYKLSDIYLTLWQVQTAIAAITLPVLAFVIELPRDQQQVASSALRTNEVLIRETWVFPILLFCLAGTALIGLDLLWFPAQIVFMRDLLVVFVGTIGLVGFAYWRALRLLFRPGLIREQAVKLAKEKMQESLNSSISVRLANEILLNKLQELNVGSWPFVEDSIGGDRYLILRAPGIGILDDIHIAGFERFIRGLPKIVRGKASELSEPRGIDSDTGVQATFTNETDIWLMKRYGENITERGNGLVRLKISNFQSLNRESLETQLRIVVQVKAKYES